MSMNAIINTTMTKLQILKSNAGNTQVNVSMNMSMNTNVITSTNTKLHVSKYECKCE